MSYAESRSKLANLLIKAGYNKAKSLRAVRYPYLESIQLIHNEYFWDINTRSKREYQESKDKYIETDQAGFSKPDDKDYEILGNKQKAKAVLILDGSRVQIWTNYNGLGIPWYSYPLNVIAKYRYKYPKDEVIDTHATIGVAQDGYATSGGEYGLQEGEIPIPVGGWLEVELVEAE